MSNRKLHLLLLAYYFPPDSSSGSFRPLFFVNHLIENGYRITVLTAEVRCFLPSQPVDFSLARQVNPLVKVIRTKVYRPRETVLGWRDKLKGKLFERRMIKNRQDVINNSVPLGGEKTAKISFFQKVKDTITDILATPDPQIGWVPPSIITGWGIKKNDVDVILATGSPWSAFLAGTILKKIIGVPLVLDFRDPWTANPGFAQRGAIAAKVDRVLEKTVLKKADLIIANTEELRKDFLNRYPFLESNRVYTISNGFEKYISGNKRPNKRFTLTHTGSLYFSRNPKPFLTAIYDLVSKNVITPDEIKIILVGGIEIQDWEIEELLSSLALRNIVDITPRVPYNEALKYQVEADVLFLIQPDFPLQVPRKLYEYMAARRHILAMTDPLGATARIVEQYGLGTVVPNRTEPIKVSIKNLFLEWKTSGISPIPRGIADDFLNIRLTQRLTEMLERGVFGNHG